MIFNNEQVDFVLLGITEADGGVRLVGVGGVTKGYLQQSRASAFLGGASRELSAQAHGDVTLTASYSGTHPLEARGVTFGEAFEALGFDPAPELAEEQE